MRESSMLTLWLQVTDFHTFLCEKWTDLTIEIFVFAWSSENEIFNCYVGYSRATFHDTSL